MTQYTVRKDDTLSAIAKKHGTTVANITGYRSGNPNMIYPGEILTIGGGMQTQTQPTTPVSPTSGYTTTPRAGLTQAPGYKPLTPKTATQPFSTAFSPLTVKETGGKIVPDTTTPPPIITPTDKPTVGVSQIDAGKQAIKDLTSIGVSTDINTIRSNWAKFGLDTKLGTWVGSAVQWNAYAKYAKDELGKAAVSQTDLQQRLYDQAVTAGGSPEAALNAVRQIPGGDPNFSPAEVGTTGGEEIPDIDLSSDDFVSIIGGISSGEIQIPEIEIAKEATKLAEEREKARAVEALGQTQQVLASQGMTFSSIRTQAEERLAAQSLANLSGISLNLASNIIAAARQEEQRRQPQIREFDNSLYSVYPDGRVVKLVEGTQQLEKATIGGKLYEKNPATGEWEIKIDDPSADMVSDVIGSDSSGYTLITYNKKTGEVSREVRISAGTSTESSIDPGHWALAERYLSDPDFQFSDIPANQMAGVSLALKEREKELEIEGNILEAIENKLFIAAKLGKKIFLTNDEITMMILDDYEKEYSYEELMNGHTEERTMGLKNSPISSDTLRRAKEIADEIYNSSGEGTGSNWLGNILMRYGEQARSNILNQNFPSIFR